MVLLNIARIWDNLPFYITTLLLLLLLLLLLSIFSKSSPTGRTIGLKFLYTTDREMVFSVPTGNFGNIYAGYISKKMGLPINKLIIATNKNDILNIS